MEKYKFKLIAGIVIIFVLTTPTIFYSSYSMKQVIDRQEERIKKPSLEPRLTRDLQFHIIQEIASVSGYILSKNKDYQRKLGEYFKQQKVRLSS